tara:strand:- start:49 stop:501 length:453 start_codon:yes stop_codon:yes gene_type:complete
MNDNYKNDSWEYIGTIGVDSGQMMLSDPSYVKHFAENDDIDIVKLNDVINDGSDNSYSYLGSCSQSNTPQQAGVLVNDIGVAMGVVCSSGFGDGGYPVYVKRHNFSYGGKRVVEMKIEFVNEEQWEGTYNKQGVQIVSNHQHDYYEEEQE